MKVLVTGGAGFIGSHLAEALVRRGHRVRVLDNFYSGKRGNLSAVAREVEVLRGDCADPAAARRATKGIDAVFHEAAIPSVARSVADPGAVPSRQRHGHALHAGGRARRGCAPLRLCGLLFGLRRPRGRRKREDMEPRPLSPYAVGKLTGEHYVRIFAGLYGMETATLRYFNVFGPRQDASSPYSGVISLFTSAMLAGRTPGIYGDGSQSRDFTYIDNVVDGNLRALTARGLRGQSINVATGRSITLHALLKALARLLGRPARATRRAPRPGDIRHSLADVSLARKLLGYRPLVDFETGPGADGRVVPIGLAPAQRLPDDPARKVGLPAPLELRIAQGQGHGHGLFGGDAGRRARPGAVPRRARRACAGCGPPRKGFPSRPGSGPWRGATGTALRGSAGAAGRLRAPPWPATASSRAGSPPSSHCEMPS